MFEHVIVDRINFIYECLNCGIKSDPPWMTPPIDIALEAESCFIDEHKDCKPTPQPLSTDQLVIQVI